MQPYVVELKLLVLNCMCHIILHQFPNKVYMSKQILSKTPTEVQYVNKSVFIKEVNTKNLWTFELGTQDGINNPLWIIVGFQQIDRQESQNFNKDTFCKPPVPSSQTKIGTEKQPDSAILLNYDNDVYF